MKKILHHLFLPKESNNYRARILHHKFLLFFTIFFFSTGLVMSYVRTNFPSVLGTYSNISSQQLLDITNQKRVEAGLSALSLNSSLAQAASGKASDMFSKNYWAHISPDGTTPWVFIKSAGYNYIYAGENLARGFTTPADVVNAWMTSPSHKENMLSSKYSDVGFAIETGKLNGEDTVLVVEMFGSTSFATKNIAKEETSKPIQVAVLSPTSVPENVNNNSVVVAKPETLPMQKINSGQKLVDNSINQSSKPLVNGFQVSLFSSRMILSIFIFVLILDMIIIERKKIIRFVGHNLDHVIFFSLILLIIFILTKGAIL